MNRPDLFIVGAPKCGTTALYSYLKQHPEIFMSPLKEPQFFASDLLGGRRHTLTWPTYLACFAAARGQKRIGEASVAYLGSERAPREIRAFNSAARIIIMLRNPVDMMYSLHSQRLVFNTEYRDFEAALQAEESEGVVLAWGVGLGYRQAARYTEKVCRYFDVFGRENVHVIIYDDLEASAANVYRQTLRFLSVREDFEPASFPRVNANRRVRSRRLHRFLTHPPRLAWALSRTAIPTRLRRRLVACLGRANAVYGPRPAMNPALRARLLGEFQREVDALSELLDRDLSHWGRT